jgi:hypothetical protein
LKLQERLRIALRKVNRFMFLYVEEISFFGSPWIAGFVQHIPSQIFQGKRRARVL